MVKIIFNIENKIFEDLKKRASQNKLSQKDLIEKYLQEGLNKEKVNNMSMVTLNDDVLEKVNIKCKLSNKTPDEVVNDVLWDQLRKIEDISDDFDGDKIWNMLEHDKPEGDDILDRITDMF